MTTMNVSTTPICPVISKPYISDMFAATLSNASRIYPKGSEMLYLVIFYLDTDFRWPYLTFDMTVNIHLSIISSVLLNSVDW